MSKSSDRAINRAIGRRLRTARIVVGITEQQAADAFRVSLRTYRSYEVGREPRGGINSTLKFCRLYKVSVDWVLEGEGATVGRHLAVDAPGKVAILPVVGRVAREMMLANKQEADEHFRMAQVRAWLAKPPRR
jgi:transcriptional regulator with XRE-family HTH domain